MTDFANSVNGEHLPALYAVPGCHAWRVRDGDRRWFRSSCMSVVAGRQRFDCPQCGKPLFDIVSGVFYSAHGGRVSWVQVASADDIAVTCGRRIAPGIRCRGRWFGRAFEGPQPCDRALVGESA